MRKPINPSNPLISDEARLVCLASPGETRGFNAVLVKRIDVRGEIIAIFRVLPNPEKRV